MTEQTALSSPGKIGETIKKIFWFLLRIGLAVGIIAFLVQNKYQLVVAHLRNFDYIWLIPAVFCYLFHFMVGSWRWYMLARVLQFRLTPGEALTLTMKAFFFSLVIPGGSIGGDFAKAGFLATRAASGTKVEGAFTILMDRIVGMVALFLLAIVVTLLAAPLLMQVDAPELYGMLHLHNSPEVIRNGKIAGIAGVLLLCLSGLGACAAMFMHRQLEKIPPVGKLMGWVDRRTHGAVFRCTAAVDLYRNEKMLLSAMVLISVIFIHLNMVLIGFFLVKGLHIELSGPLVLIAAITLGNIAGLVPLTPSGIGFRDYTVIKILEVGGAALDKAEAAAILFTALIICCNMLGGIFFIIDSRHSRKKQ